jgi:hypothetical protein
MKSNASNLIAEAVAEARAGEFKCQYCSRAFVRESTLLAHQCEPKRRAQQKTDVGVSLGYQAWLRFYELSQGSAKLKTYDDFARSQFYQAFVKFGWYCHSIKVINTARFIDFLIKNNIKIDHWRRDNIYTRYLIELLRTEAVEDALSRAIEYMQDWADKNDYVFNQYFNQVGVNSIILAITSGRISPWVLYCCDCGTKLLDKLNEEQIKIVWSIIDSEFWQRKLRDYMADAELAKHVLKEAGL